MISEKEAAESLGTTVAALRQQRQRRAFPGVLAIKVGGKWVYHGANCPHGWSVNAKLAHSTR